MSSTNIEFSNSKHTKDYTLWNIEYMENFKIGYILSYDLY